MRVCARAVVRELEGRKRKIGRDGWIARVRGGCVRVCVQQQSKNDHDNERDESDRRSIGSGARGRVACSLGRPQNVVGDDGIDARDLLLGDVLTIVAARSTNQSTN